MGITALILGMGGCTRDQYKEQADKEVYKIIEDKWQDHYGYLVNYKVDDKVATQEEILKQVPESGMLNLAQAVKLATLYSREYQSQKESLYSSVLGLTLTRHRYAMQWFGTVDATYSKQGTNESTAVNSSTGVNQDFLVGDGLQIGTGLALNWARFLTGDPQTSLGSVLTATVAAPLLGAGAGKSARENLTQAERTVMYKIRSFNRYRQNFVVSVISDYYRVIQQKNRVMIQEASYQRLIESTNQLRMEVKVGQRPAYDLGEAEQSLLSAEQSLVSVRRSYETSLDNFKIKLSLPIETPIRLDPNELTYLENEGITPIDFTEDEAILMALNWRLDLANTRDGLDDSERKLILAAEGLGPQINLVGSANVNSEPRTDFVDLRLNKGRYSVGLETDLALDQKSQRNAYRQALISVQQQQRSYDSELDGIKLSVRDAYRNLSETADTYRIQQIGLDLARQRVEVEKLSLKYGRGTVRLLLQSEDSLVRAQNDLLGALVDHRIAKLSFFRDVGILQVRPDGMWEQHIPDQPKEVIVAGTSEEQNDQDMIKTN